MSLLPPINEGRFNALIDAIPSMIWVADPDKKRAFFNKKWLDFTGRSGDRDWCKIIVAARHVEQHGGHCVSFCMKLSCELGESGILQRANPGSDVPEQHISVLLNVTFAYNQRVTELRYAVVILMEDPKLWRSIQINRVYVAFSFRLRRHSMFCFYRPLFTLRSKNGL